MIYRGLDDHTWGTFSALAGELFFFVLLFTGLCLVDPSLDDHIGGGLDR